MFLLVVLAWKVLKGVKMKIYYLAAKIYAGQYFRLLHGKREKEKLLGEG